MIGGETLAVRKRRMKKVPLATKVDRLNGIYQLALSASTVSEFTRYVYRYAGYIYKDTELKSLADLYYRDRDKGKKERAKLKEDCFKYVDALAQIALKYKEKLIYDNGSLTCLERVYDPTVSVADKDDYLIDLTLQIFVQISEAGEKYKDLLGASVDLQTELDNIDAFISSARKYNQLKEKQDRLIGLQTWASWDTLCTLYEVYSHYEDHMNDQIKESEFIGVYQLKKLKDEIQAAMDGKQTDQMLICRRSSLQYHLNTLHLAYIANLESIFTNKDESDGETIKIVFDPHTSKITAGKGRPTVKTELSSRQFHLLDLLYKSKKHSVEADLFIEKHIADSTTNASTEGVKFYQTCEAIDKKVAKAYGVTDFLIYSTTCCQVNPKYL